MARCTYTVRWETTRRFTVTLTAAQLAALAGCRVDELPDNPWDLDDTQAVLARLEHPDTTYPVIEQGTQRGFEWDDQS